MKESLKILKNCLVKATALAIFLILLAVSGAFAQEKYFTRDGTAHFNCGTSLETVEAANTKANAVLVASTGQFQVAVLMKAFAFEKDLMEQHFNENYVESDKYPKATFKGAVVDIGTVDFTRDGTYPVTVRGEMTLHGETRPLEAPGTLEVQGKTVRARSEFKLKLEDYRIRIPGVVRDKIAPEAAVTVALDLKPLEARP